MAGSGQLCGWLLLLLPLCHSASDVLPAAAPQRLVFQTSFGDLEFELFHTVSSQDSLDMHMMKARCASMLIQKDNIVSSYILSDLTVHSSSAAGSTTDSSSHSRAYQAGGVQYQQLFPSGQGVCCSDLGCAAAPCATG